MMNLPSQIISKPNLKSPKQTNNEKKKYQFSLECGQFSFLRK